MPHLTVEYTNNLAGFDTPQTLLALNRVLVASGQFDAIDIKSRAIALDTHLVGTGEGACAFVHARLAILSGRTAETKRALSEALLVALKEACAWPAALHVQLCVEVQEIERESYAKAVAGA